MVRAGNGFSVAGSAVAPRVFRQTHPSVIRDPTKLRFPPLGLVSRSSPVHPSQQEGGGLSQEDIALPVVHAAFHPYPSGNGDRRFWTIPEPADSVKLALERPSELPRPPPPPVGESTSRESPLP